MRDHLFNTEKIKYVKGGKPGVECILCAVRDGAPEVKDLTVHRDGLFIVAVNLYPFNPGHLMIFPARHVTELGKLTEEEARELHGLIVKTIGILEAEFGPSGFNVGYNLGRGSGASIDHVHAHVVPRYENEVGFLDVLAGSRVVVVDPVEARDRLRKRFESVAL
jgi:ATP adenylyltransferase